MRHRRGSGSGSGRGSGSATGSGNLVRATSGDGGDMLTAWAWERG